VGKQGRDDSIKQISMQPPREIFFYTVIMKKIGVVYWFCFVLCWPPQPMWALPHFFSLWVHIFHSYIMWDRAVATAWALGVVPPFISVEAHAPTSGQHGGPFDYKCTQVRATWSSTPRWIQGHILQIRIYVSVYTS